MTLRKGICSNHQSTRHMGEGVWPNRHITFIVAKKLYGVCVLFTDYVALFTAYVGGRGLVENVIWERVFAKNVRISSYRGEGSKIAQKTVMIFERSQTTISADLYTKQNIHHSPPECGLNFLLEPGRSAT